MFNYLPLSIHHCTAKREAFMEVNDLSLIKNLAGHHGKISALSEKWRVSSCKQASLLLICACELFLCLKKKNNLVLKFKFYFVCLVAYIKL